MLTSLALIFLVGLAMAAICEDAADYRLGSACYGIALREDCAVRGGAGHFNHRSPWCDWNGFDVSKAALPGRGNIRRGGQKGIGESELWGRKVQKTNRLLKIRRLVFKQGLICQSDGMVIFAGSFTQAGLT